MAQPTWEQYKLALADAARFQKMAYDCQVEADGAAAWYNEAKGEYRQRRGVEVEGGQLQSVADIKFSGFAEPGKALKDNAWYMTRATMYASMATMCFARAAELRGLLVHESQVRARQAEHVGTRLYPSSIDVDVEGLIPGQRTG